MTTSTATANRFAGPISVPYSGTDDQPDTVSLFFKNDQNQIFIEDENIHAALNYNPLKFSSAIWRIEEAVYKIFRCMKRKDNDLWNATKNLTRGVVALIPLIGNAALYLYDRIKTKFYTHPQIKKALKKQNGPILGIAFDGKIITKLSPNAFSNLLKNQPDNPLVTLNFIWAALIKKNLNDSSKMTRKDLAGNLSETIVNLEF